MVQPVIALERTSSPAVTPLLKTSPALNEILMACRLRAAFQNDPTFSDVRVLSTSATLGTIAHRLLEVCVRGEFDAVSRSSLSQVIVQKWDDLAATEAQNISGLAVGLVPPPPSSQSNRVLMVVPRMWVKLIC